MVLAMAGTFLAFSHAFQSGLALRFLHSPGPTLTSELKCVTSTLRSKVLARLGMVSADPFDPSEAPQVVVKVAPSAPPIASPQVALPAVAQTVVARATETQCREQLRSQEMQMRAAERAQHQWERAMEKMQRKQLKYYSLSNDGFQHAMNIHVSVPDNLSRQIEHQVMQIQNQWMTQSLQVQNQVRHLQESQHWNMEIPAPETQVDIHLP
jgi:hypothetical protein